jgi:hypothetical protein
MARTGVNQLDDLCVKKRRLAGRTPVRWHYRYYLLWLAWTENKRMKILLTDLYERKILLAG